MTQPADFHTPEGAKRDVAPGAEHFSIRDLCDDFGVTPRALRFYESEGLLNPERDGQKRIYSLRDRARLFLVLRGKRFGFSLAEIRELLSLYDLGDRQHTQLLKTLDAGRLKLDALKEKRVELDEAIDELQAIISSLEAAKLEFEEGGERDAKAKAERRRKNPDFSEVSGGKPCAASAKG